MTTMRSSSLREIFETELHGSFGAPRTYISENVLCDVLHMSCDFVQL